MCFVPVLAMATSNGGRSCSGLDKTIHWPDRWAFKTPDGELDVPALDLHLMLMLGQSRTLNHREFFLKMADHYGFTGGPFGDPDTLLRVMTETSLQKTKASELAAALEGNAAAMTDDVFARHVRILREI